MYWEEAPPVSMALECQEYLETIRLPTEEDCLNKEVLGGSPTSINSIGYVESTDS